MNEKELCLSLVNAKSEEEVTQIISKSEILNDEKNWAIYGNLENNVGTFLSQQSSPVAALTEKIVNSVDAVLLAECRKNGLNPEEPKAPRTMQDAVEQFFGIKDGDYTEIAKKRRREIASNIMIIADGDKKKPNIIIVDKGEGQNPKEFENTFLSLHKRNKIKIPFVQGKFNMGGTGALPFCGKHHYQLILSRRHIAFLSSSQKDYWGFTLVRYREGRGFEKSGVFEFCTDERGHILMFEAKELLILPENKEMEYGTFIKLYEYRLNKPSNILRDLYKDLNRSLYNPAIPFLIYENRDFETPHGKDTPVLGNKWRIRIHEREQVEEFLNIEAVLGEFGLCNIEVVVLKEDAPKENITNQNEAIFFTVNGQTHATLGRSFLKSSTKVGLDYLADSLGVFIELSNISSGVRDHAFMGSRDRMRDDVIKKGVEEDLAEVLRKHDGLRKLNQIRREKAISSNPKDEEFLKKILEKLVKTNDTLADILGIGTEIPHTKRGEIIEENFEGKRFPSFLGIYKHGKEKLVKEIPVNSYGVVRLETDAENDYLIREVDKGELQIHPADIRRSSYLYNGIITIQLIPPKNSKVNDTIPCEILLTRPYDDPLRVEFDIRVVSEVKTESKASINSKLPKSKGLNLPRPTRVYKEKSENSDCKTWEEMTPKWTEEDVAEVRTIIDDNSKRNYDVFINMDSRDLHSFLRRKKLSHQEQDNIKRLYETSILLYSLVLYNDLVKRNGGSEELLPTLIKSISRICLDLAYSEALIKSIE